MTAVAARPISIPTRIGQRQTVRTMNDFPAPVGGTITLEPNTLYDVVGIGLTTPDRFVCQGSMYFTGLWNVGPPQLIYTGSGNMFTVVDPDARLSIKQMTLDAPNATVGSVTVTPGGTGLAGFLLKESLIISCQKILDLDGGGADIVDSACGSCVDGFNLIQPAPAQNRVFSLRQFNMIDILGGVGLNLNNSTWDVFELRDVIFGAASATPGATGMSGLAASGNIPVGRLGTVASCEFDANLTNPLVNITTDDIRWFFRDNVGVSDTFIRASNTINNNATNTIIAAANTPVPLAGVWTLSNNAQVVFGGSGSQLQYIGERPLRMAIDVSVTLRAITGSPPFRVQIFKNGSAIPGASVVLEPSTAVDLPGSIPWLENTVQNDLFEIYVENLQDATDVLMTDGIIRFLGDL